MYKEDRYYKPKQRIERKERTPRRSETVDYSKAESDTESENTLSCSSSSMLVDSPVKRENQLEGEDNWNLENLWIPGT